MSLRMALIIAKEIQIRCLFDETQAIPSRNMNNAMLFEDNKDADSLQLVNYMATIQPIILPLFLL